MTTKIMRASQKGLWVSNATRSKSPETNLQHVRDFQHRLVTIRQYQGKKGEFAAAHGLGNGGVVSNIEKQRGRSLERLARWADLLGVRLELSIRLPED
ncbi:hypothetical protein SEA_MOLIVIA_72 [Arthrobacter phage Molivia]|uniref:Helix-turn-helix DNA-binding domain protein n=1 Tax=Arthrobacter phage Molivia TaxID=2015839 RepID=A0A286S2F5_9CAUD|nr:DNA binding protein [Arthrobacter phage Molivia]ASX99323.1 hypothetical protein SEA_MOLIVIA_72 [Arthrobacter phage Molivia]